MNAINYEPAHPFQCQGPTTGPEIYYGLTKRELSCINLRVPRTGDAELDALIKVAQRRDLAAMAMQGLVGEMVKGGWPDPDRMMDGFQEKRLVASAAVKFADSLLEELEKGSK